MRWIFCLFFAFSLVLSSGQTSLSKDPDKYASTLLKQTVDYMQTNRTKAMSYLQEALKLENKLADSTKISLYVTAGNTYKDQESYYQALNYYYKGLEINNKIESRDSYSILNNIGGCYYLMGNYKKARQFWEQSLKNFENSKASDKSVEGSIIYNNLAVLEKEQGNYARALEMLKEFKNRNTASKDTLNIIMAYENIANVNLKLKETDTAVENLRQGITLAKKIKSPYDIASLYNILGKINLDNLNNRDSALYYLKNAYNIADKSSFSDIKLYSSESLVKLFEKEKDYKNALQYLHTAKSLSEASINQENEKKVNRLEIEFNEKMTQNELLASQTKRERFFIFGIVLLLSFSVIIFLLFQLQKNKTAKRVAENELLAKKLEEKNKELTNSAIQMLQTSEVLQSTQKELSELNSGTETSDNKISNILADLRKSSKSFGKAEFEKIFMETEEGFYKKLLSEFPDLTKNELRLCAFLKLNLSSKEISDITHQSPHSIVVARSRLRKKLRLSNSESLNNFLIKY
ncbi:tetratricopeptide repeat protein [Epilithonimonas hungarica]|uniref:Tfp pilus assembly protein PilF n=1 Tax=Epilithonimonas hungarica TaxID=454006 RepID=A0A1G7PAG4_9FLAO|nr:tetratricopeptide repeat protein [Epilithonimonas hungarica]SDF82589.1 Tfp pilus assembly protein PilF [Epilithonimonas hungarica]